ncbi:hypothetical protein HYH03_013173 [Edaphochlamys debaryana]|uniref:Uncharacterized protein n=1 Tax=Edaphochlamys debaryana TaxID=47281 RepID=A0A836BUT0_9CHLO|nr:hypothetical protein HYH03_013173 [Edaphochlamys debaryana]|eukprot:KAG2488323.1 hypothetical protein HYH03_013173 [Edaphochlamys debaryana]
MPPGGEAQEGSGERLPCVRPGASLIAEDEDEVTPVSVLGLRARRPGSQQQTVVDEGRGNEPFADLGPFGSGRPDISTSLDANNAARSTAASTPTARDGGPPRAQAVEGGQETANPSGASIGAEPLGLLLPSGGTRLEEEEEDDDEVLQEAAPRRRTFSGFESLSLPSPTGASSALFAPLPSAASPPPLLPPPHGTVLATAAAPAVKAPSGPSWELRPGARRFIQAVQPFFALVAFSRRGDAWEHALLQAIDPHHQCLRLRASFADASADAMDWPFGPMAPVTSARGFGWQASSAPGPTLRPLVHRHSLPGDPFAAADAGADAAADGPVIVTPASRELYGVLGHNVIQVERYDPSHGPYDDALNVLAAVLVRDVSASDASPLLLQRRGQVAAAQRPPPVSAVLQRLGLWPGPMRSSAAMEALRERTLQPPPSASGSGGDGGTPTAARAPRRAPRSACSTCLSPIAEDAEGESEAGEALSGYDTEASSLFQLGQDAGFNPMDSLGSAMPAVTSLPRAVSANGGSSAVQSQTKLSLTRRGSAPAFGAAPAVPSRMCHSSSAGRRTVRSALGNSGGGSGSGSGSGTGGSDGGPNSGGSGIGNGAGGDAPRRPQLSTCGSGSSLSGASALDSSRSSTSTGAVSTGGSSSTSPRGSGPLNSSHSLLPRGADPLLEEAEAGAEAKAAAPVARERGADVSAMASSACAKPSSSGVEQSGVRRDPFCELRSWSDSAGAGRAPESSLARLRAQLQPSKYGASPRVPESAPIGGGKRRDKGRSKGLLVHLGRSMAACLHPKAKGDEAAGAASARSSSSGDGAASVASAPARLEDEATVAAARLG